MLIHGTDARGKRSERCFDYSSITGCDPLENGFDAYRQTYLLFRLQLE